MNPVRHPVGPVPGGLEPGAVVTAAPFGGGTRARCCRKATVSAVPAAGEVRAYRRAVARARERSPVRAALGATWDVLAGRGRS